MKDVKALVFDVFGTLVDWRSSVAREVDALFGGRIDGSLFADAWRAQYQPAMEEVRSGRLPFCTLDVLHRRNLDIVLERFGVQDFDDAARNALNRVWHRLDAWPDVLPGLQRLRAGYRLAPCSNGHIALMVDLARHNGFVWDAIVGAGLARDYKPKPVVYLSAADAFDLEPHEVMMVAAHSSDLEAAAAAGLRTAFVARPDECGPGRGETRAGCPVDLSVDSVLALAENMTD